jgi:hypothetical protein
MIQAATQPAVRLSSQSAAEAASTVRMCPEPPLSGGHSEFLYVRSWAGRRLSTPSMCVGA